MKIILLISITCMLNSDLVASELYHNEKEIQILMAPKSQIQRRQDDLFDVITSGNLFKRHLPKIVQTSNFAKQLINGVNHGTRMIRQVLKRPKMILVPKKSATLRLLPASSGANNHRFQIKNNNGKLHKKPIQMPVKDEIHETHHHTYSVEHIHINEEDGDERHGKKYSGSAEKHNKGQKSDYLKEIELREEKKVEAAMSQQNGGESSDIIRGKPYDFDDDWKPIERPKPASKLNTFVMDQPIAKQVHHFKHIIALEFENKSEPTAELKDSPHKHNVKPATYSVLNFHNADNEKMQNVPSLVTAETIDPDYFYNKKFNEADYLSSRPKQTKSKRANALTTQEPFLTTTHRNGITPNYHFKINTLEIPTVSSPTAPAKTASIRPLVERKKHKNLVAQTIHRGAVKFDQSEQN